MTFCHSVSCRRRQSLNLKLSPYKRVAEGLLPHRGGGAVAGQHERVGWQREQPGADTVDERRRAAAGQVGAADGTAEKAVAAEEDAALGAVQGYAAGAVARYGQHRQRVRAYGHGVAVVQRRVDADGLVAAHAQAEAVRLLGKARGEERVGSRGHHGRTRQAVQPHGAEAVVEVYVGKDYGLDAKIVFLDVVVESPGLGVVVHAGVDDYGVVAALGVGADEVGVLVERVEYELFDVQHGRVSQRGRKSVSWCRSSPRG